MSVLRTNGPLVCLCVIYFIENNISWIFPDKYFQLFDLKNVEMYLFHFNTHFLAISPHFGFYPLAVSPVYFRKDLSGKHVCEKYTPLNPTFI